MLRKVARIPILIGVCASLLNIGEVLAQFQPPGREWAGWVGALSVAIALYVCVEAFLRKPNWINLSAVLGFGFSEALAQIIHGLLARGMVLTDDLNFMMNFFSPAVVVAGSGSVRYA